MFVPSSAYNPSSMIVPSSIPNLFVSGTISVSSLDDDNEYENPPPPTHVPPIGSIEHEPTPAPPLPRWVSTTQEAPRNLVDDPTNQH